ncbi:MAG: HAD family phosphatase, partial [Bacteroidia bacterium]|nr:HAD family phosphatase [Bacteroidia bacterium]
MKKIKNIIFDLGGVIINLDMARTIDAFEAMGIPDFRNTYNQFSQTKLFDSFDKGTISEIDFFTEIKTEFKLNKSLEELKDAWNLMLLDFPKQRLELLMQLKTNYNTFLLSNTNETHIKAFEETLKNEHSIDSLDSYFNKTYYS